jgi:transcriptional regulator GlxA family with amidase domain
VVEFANREVGVPVYQLKLLSEAGGLVKSAVGVAIETDPIGSTSYDTLIIGPTTDIPTPSAALVEIVRETPARARRIVAAGAGAFILAEAGLLDGRRATTHWLHARELAARFPKVKVDENRIFVADGPIWTSAGAGAGLDAALALLEQDHGAEIARKVAQKLVVYYRRPGGQSQFSELLELEPKSDRIQRALTYARRHLEAPLTVPQLAKAAHLSPRQFSRAFLAETGLSPAKAVERLRLEAARLMLEQSRHPIEVVARQTGFADRDRMRQAFLRAFGQPPQAIRRNLEGQSIDMAASAITP